MSQAIANDKRCSIIRYCMFASSNFRNNQPIISPKPDYHITQQKIMSFMSHIVVMLNSRLPVVMNGFITLNVEMLLEFYWILKFIDLYGTSLV